MKKNTDNLNHRVKFEALENRSLLAFGVISFDPVLGTVNFKGDLNGTTADQITLGQSNGLLTHNATVGNYASPTDVDPGPGVATFDLVTADLIEVIAGEGEDVVDAANITIAAVKLYGGNGNDKLTGSNTASPLGDTIDGGSGEDILIGLGGDDEILGGDNNDQIDGGIGNDVLSGGLGNDKIASGTGFDEVDGGAGNDELTFTAPSGEFTVQPYNSNVLIFAASDGSSTGLFGAVGIEHAIVKDSGADGSTFNVHPSPNTIYTIVGGKPDPGAVPSVSGDFLKLFTEGTSGRQIKFDAPKSGKGHWEFANNFKQVNFESIERFNHVERLAVGTEAGRFSKPIVKVYDAETKEFLFQYEAYESNYRGGVRVATGDIDQDGIPDIITVPGRVHAPIVKIFSGLSGAEIASFVAMPGNFNGGLNVAVGDVVGSALNDIVVSPELGIPEVRIYEGVLNAPHHLAKTFLAFDAKGYIGGASVAVTDVNGDGKGDILVGSGVGMPSTLKMFGVQSLQITNIGTLDSASPVARGGTAVVSAKATEGTFPQLLVTTGPRSESQVQSYSGASSTSTPLNLALQNAFAAYVEQRSNPRASVTLAPKDFDLDGLMDAIFIGQRSDGKSRKTRIYDPVQKTFIDSILVGDQEWHNGFNLG